MILLQALHRTLENLTNLESIVSQDLFKHILIVVRNRANKSNRKRGILWQDTLYKIIEVIVNELSNQWVIHIFSAEATERG